MKLPMPAPNWHELWGSLMADRDRHQKMLQIEPEDSQYLHWDELRYRTPPNELTHEEWWVALKLHRLGQRRSVSLADKTEHNFSFAMTDYILRMSDEIARRAGGRLGLAEQVIGSTGRDQYIAQSLVEEAITSSQLEGATTSRRVAKEMIESGRDPLGKSEKMIFNNYRAMKRIRESVNESLTPNFILELHRILTEDTLDDPLDAGRLETADHQRVAVWDGETAVHLPPKAEHLPTRLEKLCSFANNEVAEGSYLPPVVRAIIVHFMVGYDHYFADGNGRTARALFYWSMLKHGYWLSEYVSVSKILKKAPSQYSLAYLFSEDDEGDLTYFIHYQLGIFMRALNELDGHLASKSAELAAVRESLRETMSLNQRQVSFLERASRDDDLRWSALEYAKHYRVTGETARKDLLALEDLGYLSKLKVGKANVWRGSPQLVNILRGVRSLNGESQI